VTDACPAQDIMTHIRRITAVLVTSPARWQWAARWAARRPRRPG
jgi:hypothetical protein